MDRMSQKVWLVTGCSTGLGNELVRRIIQRGGKAIATARKLSTLKGLQDQGAYTIELDVTASEHILKAKVTEAIDAYGHIDVVVHNAGAFQMGAYEDLTHEQLQRQFHTNVFAPINLTRALLPHFRERKDGTIVFIGSTSSWLSYAGASAYGASKAALARTADGLAREVGPFGIKVLTIDAGGFGSSLMDNAASQRPQSVHYEWLMDIIQQGFDWLKANPTGDTTKLANLIIDMVKGEGVAEGKHIPARFPKAPHEVFDEWLNPAPDEIPGTIFAGSDAIEVVRARCEGMLWLIEQWEGAIKSIDVGAKG